MAKKHSVVNVNLLFWSTDIESSLGKRHVSLAIPATTFKGIKTKQWYATEEIEIYEIYISIKFHLKNIKWLLFIWTPFLFDSVETGEATYKGSTLNNFWEHGSANGLHNSKRTAVRLRKNPSEACRDEYISGCSLLPIFSRPEKKKYITKVNLSDIVWKYNIIRLNWNEHKMKNLSSTFLHYYEMYNMKF